MEIPKCRKCAHCCHRCIFLRYSKSEKLFNCLIYKNKNRIPISILNNNDRILDSIISIKNGKGIGGYAKGICDSFTCYEFFKRNNELGLYTELGIDRIKEANESEKWVNENMKNFELIVKELNGEV